MAEDHEFGRVRPSGLVPSREAVGVDATPSEALPSYVVEALRGLTATQRKYVLAGSLHGDVTMSTVRALKHKALFYLHPESPNGRCGFMRLTPLGTTVQAILKQRSALRSKASQHLSDTREASKRDSARATEPKGDS